MLKLTKMCLKVYAEVLRKSFSYNKYQYKIGRQFFSNKENYYLPHLNRSFRKSAKNEFCRRHKQSSSEKHRGTFLSVYPKLQ